MICTFPPISYCPIIVMVPFRLSNTNRVSEESLRLKRNYENQSPWKRETKRCVCQNPNSSLGGAICSANEEDTCSSPIEHKGDQLLSNTRLKRDTTYINLDFERRMRLQTQESYQPDDRVKVHCIFFFILFQLNVCFIIT